VTQTWLHVLGVLLTAVISALAAISVPTVGRWMIRRLGRRPALLTELTARAHRPAQVFAGLLALRVVLDAPTATGGWRDPLLTVLNLAVIAATAWLVATLLMVVEDAAISRVRTDVRDNRHARRVHTQITVIRRVTVATVGLIAFGAMLMTFPAARAAGTSLLASAAVIGAIAALAAKSLLGNFFAGVQIAFSDAVRLDDVVVFDKQWGRIEDITLTYVVIHVWDDRRLIVPTSYLMSVPFENWTRKESALLGTIEMDVDWTIPIEDMRAELRHILDRSDLWDGRVCVLQATDAVNTLVRLRALVSASDAPTLWDLRCLVRENLIVWLQRHHPTATPRVRVEQAEPPGRQRERPDARAHEDAGGHGHARVFGDSADGNQRVQEFSGPPQQATTNPTDVPDPAEQQGNAVERV
jgi:hypothetical protein